MTSTLDSTTTVLQALRGNRTDRPAPRIGDAAILRAALEDSLYAIVGPQHFFDPLVLRSQDLRTEPLVLAENAHSLARVRGILIHHALRLLSVGYSFNNPYEELLDAWRCEAGANELLTFIDHLDSEDRAKFATEIAAHTTALRHGLGTFGSSWSLRSTVRVANLLCAGAVALRDTIDLSIDDIIKITDGPFKDLEGKVSEVDDNRGKIKVLVSMFGRETPVELDFLQVKKL